MSSSRRQVVITGLGAITPLGVGAPALHERWAAGTCGIVDGAGACMEFEPSEHISVKELRRLDRWVRNNTVRRWGPVREVSPQIVLEVAFENDDVIGLQQFRTWILRHRATHQAPNTLGVLVAHWANFPAKRGELQLDRLTFFL